MIEQDSGTLFEPPDDETRPVERPRPSDDELLAYDRGDLASADADRVRRLVARDREALDRLLDLAGHEALEGEPGFVDDDELAADWERLRRRVEGADVVAGPGMRPTTGGRPWIRRAERWIALAASLLVMVLGLEVHRRGLTIEDLETEARTPRVRPTVYTLLPDGARRGGPTLDPAIRMEIGDGGAHLRLALFDPDGLGPYRLELRDPSAAEPERVRWSVDGLVPTVEDSFELDLPPGSLEPGDYLLRVENAFGDEVATYTLSVRPARGTGGSL